MLSRALLVAVALALPANAHPVSFLESVTIEGIRFPVPMQVAMTATSPTHVDLRITGNLERVQLNLPAILSRHIENTCKRRISLAVADVTAVGETIRLVGQLQVRINRCREVDGEEIREELLRQTAGVTVVLAGEVVDGCLVMRVAQSSIRPDGLTGAFFDVIGYTARLNRDLEARLDRALTEDDNCIDIPAEFQAFDAVVTGGGFRDIGGGVIGAEITGGMEITAENFIELIEVLGRQGKLGD